jgi:hypothetical protein
VIHQRLVDLARRDLFAAAVDDLLQPTADGQITLGIEEADVSGAKPAVAKGLGISDGIVGIAKRG